MGAVAKEGEEKRGRGRPSTGSAKKKPYVPTGRPRGRPPGKGKKAGKVTKAKSPAKSAAKASGKGRGRPKKAEAQEENDAASGSEEAAGDE